MPPTRLRCMRFRFTQPPSENLKTRHFAARVLIATYYFLGRDFV